MEGEEEGLRVEVGKEGGVVSDGNALGSSEVVRPGGDVGAAEGEVRRGRGGDCGKVMEVRRLFIS